MGDGGRLAESPLGAQGLGGCSVAVTPLLPKETKACWGVAGVLGSAGRHWLQQPSPPATRAT